MSLIFVIAAAMAAREVSFVVLGVAFLVAIFAALAALPISVAIVLGAALIAFFIYRAKDPSIDLKIPIIGKFIQGRRDAKQTSELLQNPYFATLRESVDFFWTSQRVTSTQVSQELLESTRQNLIAEGLAIASSVNPVVENRKRLVDAVVEAAMLQVLVMPPEPETEETGIRGQYGVSGELKGHLLELAKTHKELREWLHGFGEMNTFDDVWNPVLLRYWITLARANVLSSLRKPLDDSHPKTEMDWYRPFLLTQCGVQEQEFRECLKLPSLLANEPFVATIEALKLNLFVNCVLQGAKYPDLDWKDRCAAVEAETMDPSSTKEELSAQDVARNR